MMQHNGSLLGNAVSDAGLLRLAKIAEEKQGHARWLSMATRRIVAAYPNHARWFCLRVMTGREKVVEKCLEHHDIEALVPTRKGPELRRRGRVIPPVDIPVLIGYTLVRCVPSDTAMAGLNTVEHVIGVLGGWSAPTPINVDFVNRYREKASSGAYDYSRPGIVVRKGQRIKISEGPFGGISGTVVTAPDGDTGSAVVELNVMGRMTPVLVPLAILELL